MNQTTLSDALRTGATAAATNTGIVQHSSDDNTANLIALGDDKYLRTPTASPSTKKSRRSGITLFSAYPPLTCGVLRILRIVYLFNRVSALLHLSHNVYQIILL